MSVRRRPAEDGGGWAIDIGVRGRRYRRTAQASLSRRQAEALERHWRAELELGRDPFAGAGAEEGRRRPELATWIDLAERWWQRRGRHHSRAATDRGHLEKLTDAIGDETPLETITTETFERVVELWRTEPRLYRFRNGRTKSGPPVSPETINARLRIARSIWTRAQSTWAQDCPPLAAIAWRDVRATERDRDPLAHYRPPDERERMMEALAATAPHARHALLIIEETGLRPASVFALDWSRIDLEAMIYRTRGKGRGGGRWLVKPITPRLLAILQAIGPRAAGPVIAYDGRAVKSIRTAIQSARRRAGLPDFQAKHLRHSTAIEILATGGDLVDAQTALDHQDPTTTWRHYGRLDLDRARQAMERRSDTIASRKPRKTG